MKWTEPTKKLNPVPLGGSAKKKNQTNPALNYRHKLFMKLVEKWQRNQNTTTGQLDNLSNFGTQNVGHISGKC